MAAFLIEIMLVPYTACRQTEGQEEILNINSILHDYTKPLEQAIDAIWILNIILSFLTPLEKELVGYNDTFVDIAKSYFFPKFIIDVLSTIYLFVNYSEEYVWMYYLKFLRYYYFFKATRILHEAIEPIIDKCNISK